jgi:hypothetical protein
MRTVADGELERESVGERETCGLGLPDTLPLDRETEDDGDALRLLESTAEGLCEEDSETLSRNDGLPSVSELVRCGLEDGVADGVALCV